MTRKFKHKATGKEVTESFNGCYYHSNNGSVPKWVVESSNDWIEITEPEVPEYVKAIKPSSIASVGEVFKVEVTGVQNYHYFKNKSGFSCSIGSSLYIDCFTPSTKAEYDAQQRTPFFRTEDGVDVFEGDWMFCLSTETWRIIKAKACINPFKGDVLQFHYFSTEAAAKEYIQDSKPCLALKEVANLEWDELGNLAKHRTS